ALDATGMDGAHGEKRAMATAFKGYLSRRSFNAPLSGEVDRLILTGPAQGAFNSWVKGTDLEDWRRRSVDEVAFDLMEGAASSLRLLRDSDRRPDAGPVDSGGDTWNE